MFKLLAIALLLLSAALGQTSSDGNFVVRNYKKSSFSLSPTQMREAERLYQSACAVVQRDFHIGRELRPRFTVVVGADRNQFHTSHELWLRQWSPLAFAQAVVDLAYYEMLTEDVEKRLTQRAIEYANATVDVSDFPKPH